MDHNVRWTWNGTAAVPSHIEVGSQCIEDLTRVCKVGLESENVCRRIWKRDEIEVQDFVTLGEKVRNHVSTSFSTSSCKHLRFGQHKCIEKQTVTVQFSCLLLPWGLLCLTSLEVCFWSCSFGRGTNARWITHRS